jgi:DNA repair exonuclease SbcCD ATPase subunit
MAASENIFSVINSHDERLQRVEGALHEVSAINVKLDYLKSSALDQNDHIMAKLDAMSEQVEKIGEQYEATIKRLEPLERLEQTRLGHLNLVRKIALGVVLAAAGVIGSRFGVQFIEWLTGGGK